MTPGWEVGFAGDLAKALLFSFAAAALQLLGIIASLGY